MNFETLLLKTERRRTSQLRYARERTLQPTSLMHAEVCRFLMSNTETLSVVGLLQGSYVSCSGNNITTSRDQGPPELEEEALILCSEEGID